MHSAVLRPTLPRRALARWQALAGASALVTMVLLVALVPQALAHQTSTRHRDGSYAAMLPDHKWVSVCDRESDGHRAYLRLYVSGRVRPPVYDADGAGGKCVSVSVNPSTLDSYNICVQAEGCGRPVYRRGF